MAQSIGNLPDGEDGIAVLESNPEKIDGNLLLSLTGRMKHQRQKLRTAKSNYDAARKEMKKDGVDLKQLDYVMKMFDMSDSEIEFQINTMLWYKQVFGIGGQLELFGTDDVGEKTSEKIAYESGYRCAHLNPEDGMSPYGEGENEHECWLNGFSEGAKSSKAAALKASDPKPELVN